MPDFQDGLPGGLDGWDAGDWGDGIPLGPGDSPKITNVIMLSCALGQYLRVTYDQAMKLTSSTPIATDDVVNPNNYAVTGPNTVTVNSVVVVQANPTIVDLSIDTTNVNGIIAGINNYTLTPSVTIENIFGARLSPEVFLFNGVSCQAKNFIAEILIGGTVIWSSLNELPQQDLELDVSTYMGTQELSFRIRGLS